MHVDACPVKYHVVDAFSKLIEGVELLSFPRLEAVDEKPGIDRSVPGRMGVGDTTKQLKATGSS